MQSNKVKEFLRTIKYFCIALSAGTIQMLSFSFMNELSHMNYWICYLVALVLSVIWNFTLNRRYTFKSSNNIAVAMSKVFVYYMIFTPISTILGNYLVEDRNWNGYLVTGLNMAVNGVTEYLYQRFFVFGKSIDSNKLVRENANVIAS